MPYRKPPIVSWQGWDDSQPSILLEPRSFRQITNWIINKGRLTPFPRLVDYPQAPSGQSVYGQRTFLDALGNWHTVQLGNDRAYYVVDGVYTLVLPGAWQPFSTNPYAVEVMLNRMFFSNGSTKLKYIEGDANWYVAGDVPGASYFLGKLASHLMMVNTIEPSADQPGATQYPARVRWSVNGNPFDWTGFTSGVEDIQDVEDQLTGWATINSTGFAFRNNGITAFSPTGIGAGPFAIENFSIGPKGIGCTIPYTLDTYGTFCCFVALDDVYFFSGAAPERIGGKAKKTIFKDIEQAVGTVQATTMGTLTHGIDYLTYWLYIPISDDVTSVWIYHFDDQTWVNEQIPYGQLDNVTNVALT